MPATFLLLSCARSAALVVFLMLTESADNALFATDGGFEFLVEASKNIAIIAAKSIEHGFGEIGESLQSQLQFMLKIRVLWTSICHGRSFDVRSQFCVGQEMDRRCVKMRSSEAARQSSRANSMSSLATASCSSVWRANSSLEEAGRVFAECFRRSVGIFELKQKSL